MKRCIRNGHELYEFPRMPIPPIFVEIRTIHVPFWMRLLHLTTHKYIYFNFNLYSTKKELFIFVS
jgi:hypothetical protein